MKKLGLIALATLTFLGITSSANIATALLLQTNDFVGISFWLVSMGMIAIDCILLFRKRYGSCIVENFNNSSRTCYWCCIRSLHVYERSLGNNWRDTNSIQIY